MLNFGTRFGRHTNRRLRQEKIIWLTTVDAQKTPQPRPVWFHWDGRTILLFSQRNKAKLRHIARNRRVAVHLDTDEDGEDVVVLVGDAKVSNTSPSPNRVGSYLRKYRKGIKDLEMTVAQFRKDFSVPVLVTPRRLRGYY